MRTVWLLVAMILVSAVSGCGKAVPKIGDVKINPKDGAEMVWIPAGEFLRGSTEKDSAVLLKQYPELKQIKEYFDSEKPQRKVYLNGYWIYKFEVTVAQFRKFCSETDRAMPPEPDWGWKDEHPVVHVTWQDAADYAQWAGASLPTEAQWEKAARSADGRTYPWGNSWDADKCVSYAESTQPVGSKPTGVSPYGCMDMVGNVYEWCADRYAEDYYKNAPARNPKGPAAGTYRVLRGGSWGFDSNCFSRCVLCLNHTRGIRCLNFGFRCARTP